MVPGFITEIYRCSAASLFAVCTAFSPLTFQLALAVRVQVQLRNLSSSFLRKRKYSEHLLFFYFERDIDHLRTQLGATYRETSYCMSIVRKSGLQTARRVSATMARCSRTQQNTNNGRSGVTQQVEQNSFCFLSLVELYGSCYVACSILLRFFVVLSFFLFLLKEKNVLFNL